MENNAIACHFYRLLALMHDLDRTWADGGQGVVDEREMGGWMARWMARWMWMWVIFLLHVRYPFLISNLG
jgi:hypothetical protein